jgi:hypothetical protein
MRQVLEGLVTLCIKTIQFLKAKLTGKPYDSGMD